MNFDGKYVNPIMKIEKLLHAYINLIFAEHEEQHHIKNDDEKRDVKLVVELKSWQSNTGRWKGSQKDVVNKIGRENETQKIMFSPE